MQNKKTVMATLAALGAQIIFGFSFMFTKVAQNFASPMTVIANRYLVAFLGLSLVMLVTKTKVKFGKNVGRLIVMSLFQPLLYFIFESYGIKLTTSAFSSIMISMIPVVTMVIGTFLLKEVPSFTQYLFTGISIGGVVLMSLKGTSEGTVTIWGIVLLLGAVVSSAGYNITSRKISSDFSVMERTYAMTFIGLISFGVIALCENIENPIKLVLPFTSPQYALAIGYLGIFSSVVAFLFLNFANTYLPVAKTTVFSNITTVVSVIAGAVFLREYISLEIIISTLMIIAGVLGVQLSRGKRKS